MDNDEKKSMRELYIESISRLLAMDGNKVVRSRVDGPTARSLTKKLKKGFGDLDLAIDNTFLPKMASEIRHNLEVLPEKAKVFHSSDLFFTESGQEDKEKRAELSPAVKEHDHELFQWAWPLFNSNKAILPTLIDIKAGSGNWNTAEDVVRLGDVYTDNWEFAEGKTPITMEYINKAVKDAQDFMDLLDKFEKCR